MIVIRSDKYDISSYHDGLFEIHKKDALYPIYVADFKYVDVEHNAVFIVNGRNLSCVPTKGTLRNVGFLDVRKIQEKINRQLNDVLIIDEVLA